MKPWLRKTLIVAGSVVGLSCLDYGAVQATPLEIDFSYSPFTTTFNNALQSTGNFAMKIVTDTTNPNLGTSFIGFHNFYAADVYVTAPTLGLNNSHVTSPTYLFFGNAVVGWTDTVGTGFPVPLAFQTIMSQGGTCCTPLLSFVSPFDLSTLMAPQGPIKNTMTEFRTQNAITFENGSFFNVGQFLDLMLKATRSASI